MATYNRIRRQQLLQEAEGYLDLAMVLSERFPLSESSRDRIARRALNTLARLESNAQDSATALMLRGQALRLMERYDEAVIPLRMSADQDPGNIHIHMALGWCYKRMNKIECAIQALEEALAYDQDEAILHYNLACYWSLAKNVGLALVHLAQAFELEPEYREMVATEPDFDPVRNHPEFVSLTSVIV
jgi:tetratricopeptide (TPR) repeat protein